jgi:hypothetical protein
MGVASSSHVIGNGLPSSTKDFYSPRVVNGRTSSSYNPTAAANQPKVMHKRRHSPPPLPSPLPKQDVSVKFPPRNEVPPPSPPSNRTVHSRPSPRDPNFQNNSGGPSPSSSPRKSLASPTVGKPRIFAMTTNAQVDELDRETTVSSLSGPPPPPYVQYSAKKQQQQQQQSMHVHQQQQPPQHHQQQQHHHHHQPSATERRKSSTNGLPSTPPLKFPQNRKVEQQQLPPTPPSHNRGGSRLSRKPAGDDDDDDDERPLSQHPLVNGSRRRKDSKSDEEPRPRPESQHVPQSHSRKDSKSDEQRPQSQHILQTLGIRSRKNSKVDEELLSRPPSQHIPLSQSSPGPSSRSRKDSKSDEQQRPRTPSRTRKLSKPRPEVNSQYSSNNDVVLPGTPDSHHHHRSISSIRTLMTKSHPSTPATAAHMPLFGSPKSNHNNDVALLEPAIQLDEDTKSKAGILLADDPFARMEGVTLLTPPLSSLGGESNTLGEKEDEEIVVGGGGSDDDDEKKRLEIMKYPSISSLNSSFSHVVGSEKLAVSPPPVIEGVVEGVVVTPPTPVSPEEHRKSVTTKKKKKKEKKEKKEKRLDDDSRPESTFEPMLDNSESAVMTTTTATTTTPSTATTSSPATSPAAAAAAAEDPEIEPEPEPILPAYTIIDFLSDPQLLSSVLTFFTFYDWCLLSSLSKEIRILLVQSPVLRETVLERFLKTVGYSRWIWDDPDPLLLSLQVRSKLFFFVFVLFFN